MPPSTSFMRRSRRDSTRFASASRAATETLKTCFRMPSSSCIVHGRTYVSGASVLHWAFAIVRSTHVDRLRRRARRPEKLVASTDEVLGAMLESAGSPESDLHAETLARIVEQELQRMSEKNRSAYILLKIEGLSAAEVAAVLGTTADAVKQRAFRAYEALREALSQAGWKQVSRV